MGCQQPMACRQPVTSAKPVGCAQPMGCGQPAWSEDAGSEQTMRCVQPMGCRHPVTSVNLAGCGEPMGCGQSMWSGQPLRCEQPIGCGPDMEPGQHTGGWQIMGSEQGQPRLPLPAGMAEDRPSERFTPSFTDKVVRDASASPSKARHDTEMVPPNYDARGTAPQPASGPGGEDKRNLLNPPQSLRPGRHTLTREPAGLLVEGGPRAIESAPDGWQLRSNRAIALSLGVSGG